jgi:hypothetical protein
MRLTHALQLTVLEATLRQKTINPAVEYRYNDKITAMAIERISPTKSTVER